MGFWMLGEGFWKLGSGSGGLWREIGVGGFFGREVLQVFAVEGLLCGEGEGRSLSGLGRWSSSGFLGKVWDEMALRGAGNFGGCEVGF